MTGPYFPPQNGTPQAPKRKHRVWPWIVGALAALVVVGSCAAHGTTPTPAATAAAQAGANTGGVAVATPPPAAPAVPAGPATNATDGTYQVGTDILAGRYKTTGPPAGSVIPNCYWARRKDDSGSFETIIANNNLQGPGSVTVSKGEFLELSGGCSWVKQ